MRSGFWKIVMAAITALAAMVFAVAAHAADMTAAEGVSGLLAKGSQQWSAGSLDAAQKTFEQAALAAPRSVDAHMKLAGLQLSRNDFSGSIEAYQRVIGLDPKNTKAWIGLGISYLHTGRNELSRAAFEQAMQIDPGRKEQLAPFMTMLNMPD